MKIIYVLKRLKTLNFHNLLKTINDISIKTNKHPIFIILDVIFCALKYQAGYMDYKLFEMYNLNNKERQTIITRGKNNSYINYFNDQKYNYLYANKQEFNQLYNQFLKRDWLVLKDNFDSFLKLITKHELIIVKPLLGSCGKGIEKIKVKTWDPRALYDYLISKQLLLVEEVINQHPIMNELYPYSVNTVRIVTISKDNKATIFAAYLRIGNQKRFVDNFNSGGMVVPLNIDSGIIEFPAYDKEGNLYLNHPVTNKAIKGFTVPMWSDVIKFANDLALVFPKMGMIGWDVAISTSGPTIVEGNEFPGHDIYQLPPHRTNNIGMVPAFESALSEIGLKKDIRKF